MRRRRAWGAAAAAVLGFHLLALAALPGLEPGGGLRDRFLPDDAAVQGILEEADLFGSSEPLAVLLEPVAPDEWPTLLPTLEVWATELESLPGIAAARGPQNLPVLAWNEDRQPFLQQVADQSRPARALALHPLGRAGFMRRDGRGAAILLDLDRRLALDFAARAETYRALQAWRERSAAADRLSVVGVLALEQTTAELALGDAGRLTAVLVAAVLVVLALGLRSFVLAFGCVAAALLNVTSTFGAAAVFGMHVSPLSFAVAPIVLSIGLLDNIHVAYAFGQLRGQYSGHEAAERARDSLLVPCGWTTFTTVAALTVLCASPVPQVRQFGLLGAVGTATALATSMALLPQWFSRLAGSRSVVAANREAQVERWAEIYRSRVPLYAALVLVALFAPGLAKLRLVADYPRVFGDGHAITAELERIEEQWGGVATVTFLLTPRSGQAGHAVHDDAVLERLRDFHSLLGARELVTGVASPFAIVAAGLQSYRTQFRVRPSAETRSAVLEHVRSLRRGSADTDYWYDASTDTYRIVARVRMMQPEAFATLDGDLRGLSEGLDEFFSVRLSGWPLAYKHLETTLLRELATSMGWAALIVAALLLAAFGSLRLWLAAVAVNAVPMIIVLGAIGWLDLGFSTALLLVPGLALGLIVDDTLHVGLSLRGQSPQDAIGNARALDGVRVPLAITSAVLVCLSVGLFGSEFAMNRTMGAVLAPIIALAWIADVVLLPALLDLLRKPNQ
jgi:predicted RND superfamily exporter protein